MGQIIPDKMYPDKIFQTIYTGQNVPDKIYWTTYSQKKFNLTKSTEQNRSDKIYLDITYWTMNTRQNIQDKYTGYNVQNKNQTKYTLSIAIFCPVCIVRYILTR